MVLPVAAAVEVEAAVVLEVAADDEVVLALEVVALELVALDVVEPVDVELPVAESTDDPQPLSATVRTAAAIVARLIGLRTAVEELIEPLSQAARRPWQRLLGGPR